MRTLLIGLMTVLLAWPTAAQQPRKMQRASGEQHQTKTHKKVPPRPAPRRAAPASPAAPAGRVTPEPLYDTEKAMR